MRKRREGRDWKYSTGTEAAVKEALLELLKTKPLAEIGVSELAREAHVSRSTFYGHFGSPADVYAALVADFSAELAPVMDQVACTRDGGNGGKPVSTRDNGNGEQPACTHDGSNEDRPARTRDSGDRDRPVSTRGDGGGKQPARPRDGNNEGQPARPRDGGDKGRPFCACVRDGGAFSPIIDDDMFLREFLSDPGGLERHDLFDLLTEAGYSAEQARAVCTFQLAGCFHAAHSCPHDADWPQVKATLDRFILGGVAACLAATSSRVDS